MCVRHRYAERTKQRVKTVELIVGRVDWRPETRPAVGDAVVALRVDWQEHEVRQQMQA